MPKSVEPITFRSQDIKYELTRTRLQQVDDTYNFVYLADIAKAWRNPKALEYGLDLPERSNYFQFLRTKTGGMEIGCRSFSPVKAALILKAAGVRVASAKKKSKKKAKSKSSKR